MKVVLGRFSQETNSFAPVSGRDRLRYFEGEDILENAALKGAYDVYSKAGFETVLTVSYSFANSGPVLSEIAEEFIDKLCAAIDANAPCDIIYLRMHGGTQLTDHEDACGYIAGRIREHAGQNVIIAADSDMHANLTPEMVRNLDVIAGYQTYPHVDQYDTGRRSAEQSLMILAGKPFYQALVRIPMIVPAEGYNTISSNPFNDEVIGYGQKLVAEGKIIDFSVYQMQPWLDLSCAGSAVLVSASDQQTAAKTAQDLAHRLFDIRKQMGIKLYDVEEVIDAAIANQTNKPVLLIDSANSPNAGSSDDSPYVLQHVVERGADIRTALHISDPIAVDRAFELGVGATGEFELGGYYEPRFNRPYRVTAYVKALYDGNYCMSAGVGGSTFTGGTALLQIGSIDLLVHRRLRNVSSHPTCYRAFGVEPSAYRLVTVKSATQYKVLFGKFTDLFYPTDTPGSSSANLKALPFEHIPRPFYPFDEIEDFDDTPVFARHR